MDLSSSIDLLRATLTRQEAELKEGERRNDLNDGQPICTGDSCINNWKPVTIQSNVTDTRE